MMMPVLDAIASHSPLPSEVMASFSVFSTRGVNPVEVFSRSVMGSSEGWRAEDFVSSRGKARVSLLVCGP